MIADIMIDCETLGVGANPIILSIGLASSLGHEEHIHIDPNSMAEAGCTTTPSTVFWWMGRSERARRAIVEAGPRVPLSEALAVVQAFVLRHTPHEIQVWSYGATADLVWVREAFAARSRKPPWTYKQERCLRTVGALFDPDCTMWPTNLDKHNALSDARTQLAWLQAMQVAT